MENNKIIDISEEIEEDDEEEITNEDKILYEGAYDPNEYAHLAVSNEIQQLFSYITYYTPQIIDIELKLKPFIPDYIPTVGDIDGFIKIPRPDDKEDNLGLTILDEPSITQSDPSLLNLKLRASSKTLRNQNDNEFNVDKKDYVVKLAKNSKDIDQWINSVKKMHESPDYNYSNLINMISMNSRLQNIEQLMQELPEKVERLINDNEILLPDKNLACSLEEYVTIICAILDIPVHTSKIASLHLLFNLLYEFKNSQHFNNEEEQN